MRKMLFFLIFSTPLGCSLDASNFECEEHERDTTRICKNGMWRVQIGRDLGVDLTDDLYKNNDSGNDLKTDTYVDLNDMCVSETRTKLCKQENLCGMISITDNCGEARDLDCSQCTNQDMKCEDHRCVCPKGFETSGEQCVKKCEAGFELLDKVCIPGKIVVKASTLSIAIENKTFKNSATFTSQNIEQVVPFMTSRSEGPSFGASSDSDITISKEGNRSTITLDRKKEYKRIVSNISLIEFAPQHVKVHSGSFGMTNRESNIILPSIDIKKSFLVFYSAADLHNSVPKDNFVRGEIRQSGQKRFIHFSRTESDGIIRGHWFIVESLGDAFKVERKKNTIRGYEKSKKIVFTESSDDALILWSNQSSVSTDRIDGAHIRCQRDHKTIQCLRHKTTKEVKFGVQMVHFTNPKIAIEEHTLSTDGDEVETTVDITPAPYSVISGQLGIGGNVVSDYSGTDLDPISHPAKMSVELDKNVIKAKRGPQKTGVPLGRVEATYQLIRWY